MDVGMLKSTATEDQMEMLMMMQTDKFPELCGLPYNNSSDILELEYSGTSTTSNGTTTTPIFHNNPHIQVAYPTLINSPASIPFMGITTTFQEAMASPLLPNLNVSEKIYPSPIFPEFVKQNGSMAAMREMMFRIAAMQPIQIDPESVKAPKRRNVKISKDPQSVAARHRRERISEKIRILQRLVPGGTKMDTASMLDEAIHYVKFLKKQVQSLERVSSSNNRPPMGGFPAAHANYSSLFKTCQPSHQMVGSMQMLR